MKHPLHTVQTLAITVMLTVSLLLAGTSATSQIYEPEGLNMPGAWNTWTNPPVNNLALASSTQVPGGKVIKIATGTVRWQTRISVAAAGGDLTGGAYDWLFTSGSTSNYYQNKWSAVTIIIDSLQTYTKEGASNNIITLENGNWYTMNFEDLGYVDTHAIFMKTSAVPVDITAVTLTVPVTANTPATIVVDLSATPCPEETFFLRYSVDAWATSAVVPVSLTGNSGTAQIPGQPAATVVSYYVFSSTLPVVSANYDMLTINLNNNGGVNYSFTVGTAAPSITFANLQWPGNGGIEPGAEFNVYGQAYIAGVTGQPSPAPGLQAWVGYHTADTDPSTWTSWIAAAYNAPSGNNDEFKANLGAVMLNTGNFYYATRFRLNADPYVYGGFSATGGGFWDGVTNVSGILGVILGLPEGQRPLLTVYPNPATGILNVDLPTGATGQLTDALGKVLLHCEFPAGKTQVDISGFRNGVYHLQLITGNRSVHQAIVKQ